MSQAVFAKVDSGRGHDDSAAVVGTHVADAFVMTVRDKQAGAHVEHKYVLTFLLSDECDLFFSLGVPELETCDGFTFCGRGLQLEVEELCMM